MLAASVSLKIGPVHHDAAFATAKTQDAPLFGERLEDLPKPHAASIPSKAADAIPECLFYRLMIEP